MTYSCFHGCSGPDMVILIHSLNINSHLKVSTISVLQLADLLPCLEALTLRSSDSPKEVNIFDGAVLAHELDPKTSNNV